MFYNIDIMSRTPIYEQIVRQTEQMILSGILKQGDKMPSVRDLSCELSINPNTIQKAYTELCNRGIIVTVPGRGGYISDQIGRLTEQNRTEKEKKLSELLRELFSAGESKATVLQMVEEIFQRGNPND